MRTTSFPQLAPRANGFRPVIEISAVIGEDPQGTGSVVAMLHVTARDAMILRQYQLVGTPCQHLNEVSSTDDEKEIEKLISFMRVTARVLGIHIKIEHGVHDLLHPTTV